MQKYAQKLKWAIMFTNRFLMKEINLTPEFKKVAD